MARAYTDIRVLREIYVSSTGHYTSKVHYRHGGHRYVRDLDLHGLSVFAKRGLDTIKLPQYVMAEIRRLVIEVLTNDNPLYYEYDRDGNRRITELRYHRPEAVAWIVECLQRDA